MKKEFVPYELAVKLKALGFDESCFGCYDEKCVFGLTVMSIKQYYTNSKEDTWNCAAPLYQQAFRWFREKYDLYSFVFKFDEGFGYETYKEGVTQTNESFDTYEEAELACLNKLIEIVEQQNQK